MYNDLMKKLDELIIRNGAHVVIESLADLLVSKSAQCKESADKWAIEGLADYADSDVASWLHWNALSAKISEIADCADFSMLV